MRLRAGIVLAISLLSSFLLAAAPPSPGQLSDGLPLEQGTYWTYECDTTRKDLNSPPVRKSFPWKMEIIETVRQHDLRIALLSGHLDDLPGIGEPKRGDYLVIAVRNRKFYMVATPNSQDLLRHLKQTPTDWAPLVQGQSRLFLELPLVAGKGFPTEQAAQENSGLHRPGFDSWLVKNKRTLRLNGLKTNVSLGDVEQYRLAYGLNKSEKRVDFVPGVGITEYDYHGYAGVPPGHSEWEGLCRLIQYYRAAGKACGGGYCAPMPIPDRDTKSQDNVERPQPGDASRGGSPAQGQSKKKSAEDRFIPIPVARLENHGQNEAAERPATRPGISRRRRRRQT